jgi:hypothetical protein
MKRKSPKPAEEDRPDYVFRHCVHCLGRTKHLMSEPPPEVCEHCGKPLLLTREQVGLPQLTVRVRIAVIINADGIWSAGGYSKSDDKDKRESADFGMEGHEANHDTLHWIEADVPIPLRAEPQTIEGEVKRGTS